MGHLFGNGSDHIPMFDNQAIVKTEQVEEGSGSPSKSSLGSGENEVTFSHCKMIGLVHHEDSFLCHGFQGAAETVQSIGYRRIVLQVLGRIDEAGTVTVGAGQGTELLVIQSFGGQVLHAASVVSMLIPDKSVPGKVAPPTMSAQASAFV